MGRPRKWTDEKLKEEALKYKTRLEFKLGTPSAYESAIYHGLLDKVCNHMAVLKHRWSEDELAKEALKYSSRGDFQRSSGNVAYQIAYRRGLLDKICGHMKYKYKRDIG